MTTSRVAYAVHIPKPLLREVEGAGLKLNNRLWLLMLLERLQTANPLPAPVAEEWRPGGNPQPQRMALPLFSA